MSRPAGEHLTKISINIPTDDLELLKIAHPIGYQLKIRELVHEYCEQIREISNAITG